MPVSARAKDEDFNRDSIGYKTPQKGESSILRYPTPGLSTVSVPVMLGASPLHDHPLSRCTTLGPPREPGLWAAGSAHGGPRRTGGWRPAGGRLSGVARPHPRCVPLCRGLRWPWLEQGERLRILSFLLFARPLSPGVAAALRIY